MILCSDFDGTLSQKQNPSVLASNLKAVQAWRNAGHIFVLVSGRNHGVIDQILPGWQTKIDYMILDNGGAIFSNCNELIYVNELKRNLIREIQKLVCNNALPISYSPERCAIELMLDEVAIKLRLWFRTEEHFYTYQQRLENQNWPIKVLPWIGAGFSKLPSGADTSQFFGFLDIVPENGGKECAIATLVELAHLNPTDKAQNTNDLNDNQDSSSNIITIGDDYNDIAMLKAFKGYAISNSPTPVIAAAQGRTVNSVAALISQLAPGP